MNSPRKRIKTSHPGQMPDDEMHLPARNEASPLDGHESSSDEKLPNSSESSSSPENMPNQTSPCDDGTHVTTVGNDFNSQGTPLDNATGKETVIHARAYQVEMFEKSLEGNIIVAMDTGSGKTQVAVLRILAELERCSDKIIWFLAPTVALCEQQSRVIKSQIGAATIKILSGADGIDTWSEKRIWDDYLQGVHVVVSTYQVLLDAVTHAFVQISQLSLIVFDEAHNCIGKHAGCKIMERYHIVKDNGMPYPAILGLTASPIVRSSITGIEKIEQTLDAVCKAPSLHREELLSIVKQPTLISVAIPDSGVRPPTANRNNFAKAFRDLDIFQDPYVLRLRSHKSERSLRKLHEALDERTTPITKQMRSTYRKSAEIHRELGPWASDYFLYEAVTRFLQFTDNNLQWFETRDAQEKKYIANILRGINLKPPQPLQNTSPLDLSDKFAALVKELQSAPDGTRCIVFVLETTTVAILAHMLSNTASLRDRFQVGTMIGTSNYVGQKRDLGDINQGKNTLSLEDFRTGKLNLLVATSVAEEGIDVPACNLVICFNAPPNVKSFIQRRGRARMERSRIILLTEGLSNQHETWIALENMMKQYYEDDMRVVQKLVELEELDLIPDIPPLCIPGTGAQLDFDQAKSHLEHFCQKITSGQYIEHRPYYISEEINGLPDGKPRISATVHLPASLPTAIRRVRGLRFWYSERNAFKDAAFQAFKAVYEAGLVNGHLMPLMDDFLEGVETRGSILEVDCRLNPWCEVAKLWEQQNNRTQREILWKNGELVIAKFEASLPCYFPELPPFDIYWDTDMKWTIESAKCFNLVQACALNEDQSVTLIDSAYGHRWTVEDFPHILHLRSTMNIPSREHAEQQDAENVHLDPGAIIRDTTGVPYLFIERLPCKPALELVDKIDRHSQDAPTDIPWLAVRKWPRRLDLFHPSPVEPPKLNGRYPRALPVTHCTVDTTDSSHMYFGSIIPYLVHVVEVQLIAEELCSTVLESVGFSDKSHVVTAISSRAAKERSDYERLEFLGDSVLKLLATVSVLIQRPHYPESYLSPMKDRIVSNSRLCRASVENGLDKFILTEPFTGKKWRPLYIKDFLANDQTPARREMSTKTLADVIESLIGAAYEDGGEPKALACLNVFLPEVKWYGLTDAHEILFNGRDIKTQPYPGHEHLEECIGYTFRNKALLMEALTHGSWVLYSSEDVCMERLEFLGDPILDSVVVAALWAQELELSNNRMHLARTASVNADLLGFLVMEWCTTREVNDISVTDLGTIVTLERVPFWKYMRFGSPEVVRDQKLAKERHAAEREAILDAMAHGAEYPWVQLAHLHLPKFFSDMFEALLGAVWVDSGSMETCTQIVESIGILPYLRRILSDNVEIRHPKNKLGELVGRTGKRVRYETEVRIDTGVKDLFCRIFINEELFLEVGGGVTPEEVMTKAANLAYHSLINRGNDMEDAVMT